MLVDLRYPTFPRPEGVEGHTKALIASWTSLGGAARAFPVSCLRVSNITPLIQPDSYQDLDPLRSRKFVCLKRSGHKWCREGGSNPHELALKGF